jgi:hypothetical protein
MEFPTKAMRDELRFEDFWLAGVENSNNGKGAQFNFVLSNGKRTAY